MSAPPTPVFCLAGPTGCGKTEAALALADALDGEIVNADSRQVYADFPLITAQPTPEEMARHPHHLYGFLPSGARLGAGAWADMAADRAGEIAARGRTPILVGGTGLYFRALLRGVAEIPPIPAEIAAGLAERLRHEGPQALHAELSGIDPDYAARIHPNDRQRVARALEVWRATGRTFTWWHVHAMPEPRCAGPLAFFNPRLDDLAPRLARRIRLMLDAGAEEEARAALGRCGDLDAPGWSGIGCAELGLFLTGCCSLEECVDLWTRSTRAYAKRQLTWFRAVPDAVAVAPGDVDALIGLARRSGLGA